MNFPRLKLWRKSAFTIALLGLAVLAAVPAVSSAQTASAWPTRAIRIIVGFPPGSSNDILARLLAEPMSQTLGQSVVVENKAGADAIVGTDFVAHAPPDGYTLLSAGSGPLTINPAIYDKLPYDSLKDLTPIAIVGTTAVSITARTTLGAKTLADVIRIAKGKPDGLTFGSGSTSFQLAGELIGQQAGIKLTHIPYRGGAPALQALAGGEVDLVITDVAGIVPLTQAGRILAIALSDVPRPPGMGSVPLISESGLPGFDLTFILGLNAPAGTPPAVIQKLYDAVAAAMSSPALRERLTSMGINPNLHTPAQSTARIKRDLERFSAIARTAKIKAAQ